MAASSVPDILLVNSPADFHVHLRQGLLSKLVTPHVYEGGFVLCYVMPNTSPPITTTEMAVTYKAQLQAIDPRVEYMMTLFLSPNLTPSEIRKAKKAGVVGVKSYPRGVTTGSESGIESYDQYYPVFEAMQEENMVLNLHGEVPSNPTTNTTVISAEQHFLPHLHTLHARFPRLRIVLEHVTTRAAVEVVRNCGPTVAATITAHHLSLVVDDWAGQSWHFCKPVAKTYDDRAALRDIVLEGHPRFFLGSDSAPHPPERKSVSSPWNACAAGVYTSPILLPLLAQLLEEFGALENLENFVSKYGRAFYKVDAGQAMDVKLRRCAGRRLTERWNLEDENGAEASVVPFWAGKEMKWEIVQ